MKRSVLLIAALSLLACWLVGQLVAQPPLDDAPPVPKEVEVVVNVEPPELGTYWPCRIVRVLDGDTLDVSVTKIYRIRLNACWAPEIHGPQKEDGLRSKAYLEKLAKDKTAVVIIPWQDEAKDELTLNRYLGRIIVNGTDLGKEMVRKKLAGATKEEEMKLFPVEK